MLIKKIAQKITQPPLLWELCMNSMNWFLVHIAWSERDIYCITCEGIKASTKWIKVAHPTIALKTSAYWFQVSQLPLYMRAGTLSSSSHATCTLLIYTIVYTPSHEKGPHIIYRAWSHLHVREFKGSCTPKSVQVD